MDSMDDKLDKIMSRVSHLESEVLAIPPLKEKMLDLEKSVDFISKAYDGVKAELKAKYESITSITNQSVDNKSILADTAKRISDLESRSMRDNLLLTGVPEHHREDPEETVREIIRTQMGISQPISFERVHRIGPYSPEGRSRPRTIVAKFSRFKDRELFRTNAKNLKGTKIGIHEQYSRGINDKRKVLYEKFKEARENNQYARMVLDYLIIDNHKYTVNSDGIIIRDKTYSRPPPHRFQSNRHNNVPHRSSEQNDLQSSSNGHPPARDPRSYSHITAQWNAAPSFQRGSRPATNNSNNQRQSSDHTRNQGHRAENVAPNPLRDIHYNQNQRLDHERHQGHSGSYLHNG